VDRPLLITGAAGFAGSHLIDLLAEEDVPLAAWHRPGGRAPRGAAAVAWRAVDVLDRRAVELALRELHPSVIYHLAAAAHPGRSWVHTTGTLRANVLGTHHVLEAARRLDPAPALLLPGSAMIYRPAAAAIREDDPLGPANPYGLSKLAQEMLGAEAAVHDRLRVFLARPFNHIGPRQDDSFSTSGFARQIAEIEAGGREPVLHVGNLDACRDLTDVRDTVRAYRALVERGRPGRPYNICSGRAHSIRDILAALLRLARLPIEIRVDPARLRPADQALLLGDPARIRREAGWTPQIPLERTLRDLLDYWRGAR
jgi:GDP-4-dehydro-6-deoxy-D-mannose reductase